jgi:hypothetical protein
MLTRAQDDIRKPLRRNCSFYGGWRNELEVRDFAMCLASLALMTVWTMALLPTVEQAEAHRVT